MDPDLLGNLLDQHAAALELYARQWCDVPEDVVQDAFLKLAALRVLPENPAAWLFRVVRNGAIDAGQAARRRKRYETAAATWSPPWFEADPDERPGAVDPEQAASELQALPIDKREIISINGQINPAVPIKPGEIQFWRLAHIGAALWRCLTRGR